MTVYVEKPAVNLREELASLRNHCLLYTSPSPRDS